MPDKTSVMMTAEQLAEQIDRMIVLGVFANDASLASTAHLGHAKNRDAIKERILTDFGTLTSEWEAVVSVLTQYAEREMAVMKCLAYLFSDGDDKTSDQLAAMAAARISELEDPPLSATAPKSEGEASGKIA